MFPKGFSCRPFEIETSFLFRKVRLPVIHTELQWPLFLDGKSSRMFDENFLLTPLLPRLINCSADLLFNLQQRPCFPRELHLFKHNFRQLPQDLWLKPFDEFPPHCPIARHGLSGHDVRLHHPGPVRRLHPKPLPRLLGPQPDRQDRDLDGPRIDIDPVEVMLDDQLWDFPTEGFLRREVSDQWTVIRGQ